MAFVVVLAVVVYVVDKEGHEKIRLESAKLVAERGNTAVNEYLSRYQSRDAQCPVIAAKRADFAATEAISQASTANAFDKRDYNLLGSGGIAQKKAHWAPIPATHPFLMVRQNGDYQAVLSNPNPANPYYQELV